MLTMISHLAISLAKFKVERQWKGPRQRQITAIVDIDQAEMCGDLNLQVGNLYLIYAPLDKGRPHIYTDCGPNRQAEYAENEITKLKSFWFRLYARIYPYPKV